MVCLFIHFIISSRGNMKRIRTLVGRRMCRSGCLQRRWVNSEIWRKTWIYRWMLLCCLAMSLWQTILARSAHSKVTWRIVRRMRSPSWKNMPSRLICFKLLRSIRVSDRMFDLSSISWVKAQCQSTGTSFQYSMRRDNCDWEQSKPRRLRRLSNASPH